MAERVRLYAVDADDLKVISALMQDAAIPAKDVAFDRDRHRLVLMGSRYCWERKARTRVRTALRIDGVLAVQRKNWPTSGEMVLNLLALRVDGEMLVIEFSDTVSIRAKIEALDVEMHDVAGPWGARSRPKHKLD